MALGLGAAAWACGRGGRTPAEPTPAAADRLSVLLTMPQLSVGDTRMAFALATGQRTIAPDDVQIGLYGPDRELVARPELTRERIGQGLGGTASGATKVTTIYVFRHAFSQPGVWTVDARTGGQQAQAAFQLTPADTAPRIGQEAISIGSPTVLDALGVDPICTRTPACSMHQLSLDAALEQDKPLVLNFGTPRFCTSRTCGPVVDIIEEAKREVGEAASFIHVEVWRDDAAAVGKPDGYAPTFRAWKLPTEPYTFFIGADGLIRDRWAGAIGDEETKQAVRDLVAGKLGESGAPGP